MIRERAQGNDALAALIELAGTTGDAGPAEALATFPAILLRVGTRWYGVDANLVREVVHRDTVTRVPAQPGHILGVALVHGRMVAVVDLDRLLDIATSQATASNARLVVLHDSGDEVALAAEEARGVFELPAATGGTHGKSSEFVTAELPWNQRLVCMLDGKALVAKTCRAA